ncbi:MAG: ABC transporter permease [Oscillospiraceae bacterium]|nr:ABC transporter permease [Oscillospiraceae bacterium]
MNYFLKRTFQLVCTVFVVSLITFAAFYVIPGDPARVILGPEASDAQVDALRAELGLDRPMTARYFEWVSGAFRGDLGRSLTFRQPVSRLIAQKLPVTLSIAAMSLLMTVIVSFPLGIIASGRPGKFLDQFLSVLGHIFFSFPPFVLALLMTLFLGLTLKLFVAGEYISYTDSIPGFIASLFYPSIAVAIPKIAISQKFVRASIIAEKEKDYIRTAKSHGLSDIKVMRRHIIPNSLVPIITVFSIIASEILGGILVVEMVFNIPGISRLLITSINARDFPLTEGIVLYLAVMTVIVYFIADILHSLVDPRIRLR